MIWSSLESPRQKLRIELTAHARQLAAAYVSLSIHELSVPLLEESGHGSFCVCLEPPPSLMAFPQLRAAGSESA